MFKFKKRVSEEIEDTKTKANLIWNRIVSKYVYSGEKLNGITTNTFDYSAASKDSNFTIYLNLIKTVNTKNMNQSEFYAFYINVYNALAINMILSNPCKRDLFGDCGPITGIRDIGTIIPLSQVWNKPAGIVGGVEMTLNEVEDKLRHPPAGISPDPRLHLAIVCASISCPNLRNQSFVVENLDFELTRNFNNFLKNKDKGMLVDRSKNRITLSSIFKWFATDFVLYVKKANPTLKGVTVLDYLLMFLDDSNPDYTWIARNTDKITLSYFDYDWELNAHGKIPCDSTDRPCFQLWTLLVTLGSIFVVTIVAVTAIMLIRWKKKAKYTSLENHF